MTKGVFIIGRTKDDRDMKWVSLDGHKAAKIIGPSNFLAGLGVRK